jgi:hypothetical protein
VGCFRKVQARSRVHGTAWFGPSDPPLSTTSVDGPRWVGASDGRDLEISSSAVRCPNLPLIWINVVCISFYDRFHQIEVGFCEIDEKKRSLRVSMVDCESQPNSIICLFIEMDDTVSSCNAMV